MKINACLLPFLLFVTLQSFKADNERDSLSALLKHQTGTERISTLIAISDHVVYTSPADAIVFADEAMTLAEKSEETALRFKALKARGYANGYAGNIATSIADMQEGLDYYTSINDSIKIAEALSDLGYLHQSQGLYDKTLENYQLSLSIRKKIADEKGIAYSYNNLGTLYWRIGKLDEALEFYLLAIPFFNKTNLEEEIAVTTDNIGEIYSEKGDYELALQYFESALKINNKLNHTIFKAKNYISIGKVFFKKGNFSRAIKHFNIATNIQQKAGDKDGYALSQYLLGRAYLEKNDLQTALQHFTISTATLETIQGNDLLIQSLESTANIHYRLGDFQKAYETLNRAKNLNDSIFTLKQTQQIEELKMRYETEKHIIENANLKQSDSKNKTIIKQQRILLALLFGVGLLISLALWLWLEQRRSADKLRAITMEQKLLRSQMNPHFIYNTLTVIQNYILSKSAREGVNLLSSLASLMRLILENSSHEFIPFEKEIETLEFYLLLQQQRYTEHFDYQLVIDPTITDRNFSIPPMLAQPFIENSIEHGFVAKKEKGHIWIRYYLQNELLICEIEDNGIGFKSGQQQQCPQHHSYGIEITKQRIHMLSKRHKTNAGIEIIDKKHHAIPGVLVRLTVPIKKTKQL